MNRGQITVLDLMQLPSLTPRQIQLLARESGIDKASAGISNASVPTALLSMPADYLAARICSSAPLQEENFSLTHQPISAQKALGAGADWAPLEISPREGVRMLGMPTMDGEEEEGVQTSFRVPKGVKAAAN